MSHSSLTRRAATDPPTLQPCIPSGTRGSGPKAETLHPNVPKLEADIHPLVPPSASTFDFSHQVRDSVLRDEPTIRG